MSENNTLKDFLEKEIQSIASLAKYIEKSCRGNVWYQRSYIQHHLAELKLLRAKIDGVIKSIEENFKRY